MDDPLVVGVFERRRNLRCDLPGVVKRQRSFSRCAFGQLHHQRTLFDAVDGRYVGVVEGSLRFALKARHALRVASERLGQYFDCYIALQLGVASTVDLSHPALAQQR